MELRRDLWHQITKVPDLVSFVLCMVLCLAVFVELRLVRDRQTDEWTERQTL